MKARSESNFLPHIPQNPNEYENGSEDKNRGKQINRMEKKCVFMGWSVSFIAIERCSLLLRHNFFYCGRNRHKKSFRNFPIYSDIDAFSQLLIPSDNVFKHKLPIFIFSPGAKLAGGKKNSVRLEMFQQFIINIVIVCFKSNRLSLFYWFEVIKPKLRRENMLVLFKFLLNQNFYSCCSQHLM